ncbi:CES5A [Bugula neritina]|uniref:Carboxylic ester hydrolase n=1 Tax=Bugula neritina TaxID=10212 RepID=A0A7J7IVU7_BUGNE|nr:CES5A [Bugula neritina]
MLTGVRYAAPPVGSLRFKRPAPVDVWTGVRNATSVGQPCAQRDPIFGASSENEDCLFLDITVPGGVDMNKKMPVMVWIYGGGYAVGSKNGYLGTTLAVKGDVIVVTINYRLAMLGFLYDGPGTGNFGLWDQRAAIMWVKQNIDKFGGDPGLITIFGESAGGGSVSAQMMSHHNGGLFQRAIQESGSLYTDWGWFNSKNQLFEITESIRNQHNCSKDESVYKCLENKSVDELLSTVVTDNPLVNHWHPVPDDDFFPGYASQEVYNATKR